MAETPIGAINKERGEEDVMADDAPNLVLEHLRAIRAELHEVREEQREQRLRLGAIARGIADMASEIAPMGLRLDRMERRLDLVEA